MSREWKPGDMATVSGEHVIFTDDDEWQWVLTGLACLDQEGASRSVRPLVVIDPEDREQVERLVRALLAAFPKLVQFPGEDLGRHYAEAGQAALCSLVAPPKPDEPMGLGAVVEDDEGRRYVRIADHRDGWMAGLQWMRIGGDLGANRNHGWPEIAAVHVLSEGVA